MAEFDPKQMFDGMRDQLEADQADGKLAGLTVEDLKDAMSHPEAGPVVAELMAIEAKSVQQGEPAPDFTLPWLPGSAPDRGESMTLSTHFGKRPVALVFGSYT
ncbi:MAG: hypothetical protein QNK03_06165 [Myxococcota bacterium]|nr:hypothetical protein [Myxococcota bacterium]